MNLKNVLQRYLSEGEVASLLEEKCELLSLQDMEILTKQIELSVSLADKIRAETEQELTNASLTKVKTARNQTEALTSSLVKQTVSEVAELLRTGATEEAKEKGREIRKNHVPEKIQDINRFTGKISKKLERLLGPEYSTGKKLEALIEHKDRLNPVELQNLKTALEIVSDTVEQVRKRLSDD